MPKSNMLLVIATAAICTTHAFVSHRRQRHVDAVACERIHQESLAAHIADPSLNKIWAAFEKTPPEKAALQMQCNRWVSWWLLRYQLGVTNEKDFAPIADDFMRSPEAREYWVMAREVRGQEDRSRKARAFVAIMNESYTRAVEQLDLTA